MNNQSFPNAFQENLYHSLHSQLQQFPKCNESSIIDNFFIAKKYVNMDRQAKDNIEDLDIKILNLLFEFSEKLKLKIQI